MIQVVMFDLGLTLLDASHRPFPHAVDALTALAALPIKSCLLSDFPATLSVSQAMTQYLAILDAAGLKRFFEPAEKRVTLSNHVGVNKPDRKIFEKALERLGATQVPLTDCLFVTENSAHIEKAKTDLGMSTLQFGLDFTDWSDFPRKLAEFQAAQSGWISISVPGHADLANIQVQVPSPNSEHVAEVQSFVASLAEHGRIAGRPGKPAFQPTHVLELDALGNRRLVRKSFTALQRTRSDN